MKIILIALLPSFQERVDAFIAKYNEDNSTKEYTSIEQAIRGHKDTCPNCTKNALIKWWSDGTVSPASMALPADLIAAEVSMTNYDAMPVRDELHVLYEGKAIDAREIPGAIGAHVISDRRDNHRQGMPGGDLDDLFSMLDDLFKR